MNSLYDLPAPAKLNLFLHVTGRRDDGYHLLQSAFMLVDWCDVLHIERRAGSQISREDLGAALPADDLCLRAARLLQQATGCTQGAHIAIDKRIPAQAGMGGGSSDAATCLLALNRLWQTGLAREQLLALALQLGADVPFFVGGHNAWVEGIGEQLTPIELPPARFVIIKPPGGLATAAIFSSPLLKRATERAIIAVFAANQYGFGKNDLQDAACRLDGGVARAIGWLQSLGFSGKMTGSGSAVFAHLPENRSENFNEIFSSRPADLADWDLKVCDNMRLHPLAGWSISDSSSVVVKA
ncbi:MAG: 4-diphosphocytidyl-2-C-methyl-D-erythritol kinase [Paracidovorax wautersii]|uniref:4-diphosphocytidyl-2-C-methyl-D-erythritol kinase n=1 Tax=Paracidovorax wautersii TaxID=1177982 RepID=A0A7V8FMD1_9BURK|nr:MAG: 4-diphosphocytidyl-2-C-methyl-D-erythritol kinase [Paracidovorax wautersii]